MLTTCFGILIRIISNSYLNVFQKLLTNKGQKSSVVNFYTYLGLAIAVCFLFKGINTLLIPFVLIMGLLGALGNFFIIKALSIGELSTLAPINSYKPVVALIIGIIFLNEIPAYQALIGIILIIIGTYFILGTKGTINLKALLYRMLALIFSASEAIVIKKIILATDITEAFVLWVLAGLLFSFIFLIFSRNKPEIKSYKYQILLIFAVGVMQYSTNFVFSKMNVSYALALFQLSTILSVFLGVNIFNEKGLKRKLLGSLIMVIGAAFIILS